MGPRMPLIELSCALIVALYVVGSVATTPRKWTFLIRFGWLALAATLAETSTVRLYGFYHYDSEWSFFLDRVPLLVALIWPCVIDSAGRLKTALGVEGRLHPAILVAGVVLSDAALIEPIASNYGLWEWTQPGLFGVPPIGIVGWAVFALLCELSWRWAQRAEHPVWRLFVAQLGVLVGLHGALLSLWWGGNRWLNTEWPDSMSIGAAWIAAGSAALLLGRTLRSVEGLGLVLLQRTPASLFFLGLLFMVVRERPRLGWYGAAFVLPYATVLLKARLLAAPRGFSQRG